MNIFTAEMISLVLLLMLVGFGGYAFYTWIRLRRNWGFFPNKLLMPANCPPEECVDENGFLEYMSVRLLILSLLCFACAIIHLPVVLPNIAVLLEMDKNFYEVYGNVVPFFGFVVLAWYMFVQHRAAKRFW